MRFRLPACMKWSLNDRAMSNALWLCLRTNTKGIQKEPTIHLFGPIFAQANTNIYWEPFKPRGGGGGGWVFIVETACKSQIKTYNRSILYAIIRITHVALDWGLHTNEYKEHNPSSCFWLFSASWQPVWTKILSGLLIKTERAPIHPRAWLLACETF